ncbi:MAG TPA: M20/M25/M40 family metallo-hydrolase [Steroidobacteraceae bacterium]|jgi:acetylornithine deacetylase/succinyl-diaminopimelate desuccinylase-like protein
MRLPLLAALSAVFSFGSIAGAADSPHTLPPPMDQELARDILKGLVEINSTHSHGTTQAAEAVRQWLTTAGFAPGNMVFVAPPEFPRSGNLIVYLRAKAQAHPLPPVLFLGHLDVVEAKPEDWSVDPFRLTEKEGFFYGRGTIDMKDGDAALVESLIRLKREHYVPARDLIVAFTADEEAGGDANGPAFLLKAHRDLINAGLVVNLDGGGGTFKNGTPEYFELGTSEKNYVTFTLETTSAGGHGSLPGPDNAIYRLAQALGRIEAFKFPLTLSATTRATFTKLADLESGQKASDMRAVAASADPDAAGRLSEDVWDNAELRTTCVATLISGGHAENALPQRAKSTIQCRMLPGDSETNVQTLLTQVINDPKVSVTLDAKPILSPESPPTPQILKLSETLVHSMWPGVPVIPTMATGFSDDRQTRNAGIPSYDLSGVFMEDGENRAHGRDERVGVRAFDESVEYTYRLMKAAASLR